MGNGWGLNHHGYLDVNYVEEQYIEHEPSPSHPEPWTEKIEDYTDSIMIDENGSSMQFHCASFPDRKKSLTPDIFALKLGVTNCSKGVISARTSWKNTKINYFEKFHAITGSGAHYQFDKHKKDSAQKDIHRLLSITKPNCNKFKYDYNSHYLTEIKCQNMGGSVINSVKIDHPKTNNHHQDIIQVTAQDGRQISYTFMDKKQSGAKKLVVNSSCGPSKPMFTRKKINMRRPKSSKEYFPTNVC